MLLSCEDNTKALKEINSSRQDPLGIASNIRMVYSDSLKIQAILTAPKHVDYSNLEFKFAEFPEGLEIKAFESPRFVKELRRAEPRATHAFFSPVQGEPLTGKSLTP